MIKDSLVWRFWIKFDRPKEGCWEWKASRTTFGYGLIGRFGRGNLIQAHRLAWLLFNGPIPDGLCVLHKCDNPPCVRPGHLFLGTKKDNSIDRNKKGRNSCRKGENNGRSKLTVDKVKQIRKLRRQGLELQQLSKMFATPISTIIKVVYKQTWTHI